MQKVIFYNCTGLKGTAELEMIEIHIHVIRFGGQPPKRFLIPHFILSPLVAFPFAGAVDKLLLPEGMQTASFWNCRDLTGTAKLRDE